MTKQPVPPVSSNYYQNLSPNSQEIPFGKSPIKKRFNVYSYNMAKPVPQTSNLLKIARRYHIPIYNSIEIWENHPDYEQLNPEEDYDIIINSIKNAEKLERLDENPPAILGVSKKLMGTYGIPQWYYVKKDLLYVIVPDETTTWSRRKKKSAKPKPKCKVVKKPIKKCRCKS